MNLKEITFENTEFNNDAIKNLGAIFLGYDTFLQGEVLSIVNYLENKGFNILKCKVKSRLDRSEAEDIFLADNAHINSGFKWWMVSDLVTSGPMACILVHFPECKENCLTELNYLKGPGDPFENTSETIRGKFKSINIAMNLIHVPDNYSDFMKDTSPFFKVDEIREMVDTISKNNMFKEKGGNYLSKRENFELEFYSERMNSDYSFFKSLYHLKFEILKSLNTNSLERDYLIEVCIDFQNVIDNDRNTRVLTMRQILHTENYNVDLILTSLKELISFEKDLTKIIYFVNDYKKMYLYKKLCDELTFKLVSENDLRQLEAEGVFLPKMHKHILITSLSQWKN